MKPRLLPLLVVSATSMLLTACGTTGSTANVAAAPAAPVPLSATLALASAGGDVLSGSFGHEAVGASQLNLSQNEAARQARAQAEYDYRSYVVWKGSQKS